MASTGYRPSSCHGIVGSDGTRRVMARDRLPVTGLTAFTGFTSRARAASLTASTSSTVRQRIWPQFELCFPMEPRAAWPHNKIGKCKPYGQDP